MKFKNMMILAVVLIAILSFGAVSAQDSSDDLGYANDADSLSVHQTTQLTSNSYNKEIHVDSHGDDSGSGGDKSPYASLNKAISEVNASDNAVIYMAEGIYTGEDNTDLTISLAHNKYDGSLTIIGAGKDKTIIDANKEAQIFKLISADSIVTLKDIGFINGKAPNYGSAIINSGDLTIDGCLFENNTAQSYAAVYQNGANNLKITNSVFNSNAGTANNDIYYYVSESSGYNFTLINSSFKNAISTYQYGDSASVVAQAQYALVEGNTFTNISSSGKSSLFVRSPNGKVLNNKFIDCSYSGSQGGILYVAGNGVYLEGNTFENYTSSSKVPLFALMNFNAKLAFNDMLVEGTTFKLTCNVTDDMDNPVDSYYYVNFYFDGKNVGRAQANDGVATLTLNKLLDNGTYELTGNYGDGNPLKCDVVNGTVTVDFDHNPLDVWVSATGNDTSGDGSESNPFLTIKHAIDFAIDEDSVEFTVHIKNGFYNITGDYALSYSDVINLNIVGENYGEVIISGNNANGFLTSGVYTNVFLQNLTLVNFTGQYSRTFNVRYLVLKDCIVDKIGQLYAQSSPSSVVFDNVIWTNTQQLSIYNAEIYNSHFENVTSTSTGSLWLATVSADDVIIIENSKFINMVCSGSSGAGVAYIQGNFISINNIYDSNKATSRGYGALYAYGNRVISINDTFTNNKANTDYGAIYFGNNNKENAVVEIINAKFINNTAGGFGGALGIIGGNIINCTFENNTAATLGGAIYIPTHSSNNNLFDVTLTDVTFNGNSAGTNGKDIYIVPKTSASALNGNLNGMTVSFNDLTTTTLQDKVVANVTHSSGAVIGGGTITFNLDGSYMGVANVVDGKATLDYLGFKTNGTYDLSGVYDLATADTVFNNATVTVALAPLKDNVTLYVSNSKGDDEKGDGSFANPYKTINTALINGYKQSAVIVIRVLEGTYAGDLNTNLTIAASLDISIIGDGQDITIIDGRDLDWFLKILSGDGIVKIADLTVANVTKNYVDASLYNQMPALSVENGASVSLDNVKFIRCHGTEGGAIYSQGLLEVKNSYFFNNGDSNNGAAIKSTGTVTIYNSTFIANHAKYYSTIYNDGQLFMYDSIIQDSMRVNGWTGNAMAIGGAGNITMVNSVIERTGRTSNDIIGTGQTWANNPGFAISIGSTGNVKLIDCVIDGNNPSYSAQYISNVAFGGAGSIGVFVPYGLEVINTKILNLRDLISGSRGNNLFEGCYIENVTYAAEGTSYDYNLTIKDSYFADGTTMITKRATANVVLDNNWWGTNDQPTYKVSNVNTHPATWLVLTLNATDNPGSAQKLALQFKVSDGENITDYDDSLYPRDFTISAINANVATTKGTIGNAFEGNFNANGDEGYYLEATVDNQQVNLTVGAVIIPEDVELMVGETQIAVTVLTNEATNFNVTLTVNKKEYQTPVIDGVALFTIDVLPHGEYTLDYTIKGISRPTSGAANLTIRGLTPSIEFVSDVANELMIILTGEDGVPLSGEEIDYLVNSVPGKNTTDDNGHVVISNLSGVVKITAEFGGNDYYVPLTVSDTIAVFEKTVTKISIISVDGDLNIKGILTDVDGNPLSNATIKYMVGNSVDTTITDDGGNFAIKGENTQIGFVYEGTDYYASSDASISLKDIAPTRQTTRIDVVLGTVAVGEDLELEISVANVSDGKVMVYYEGEITPLNLTSGNVKYIIEKITAGNKSVIVAYSGDSYHEATVGALEFTVYKKASSITVSASQDVIVGQKAIITVNVTEGATGIVLVDIDGVIYPIDLSKSNSLEFTTSKVGSCSIVATYAGDDKYDSSVSDSVSLNVKDKQASEMEITVPSANAGQDMNIVVSIPNASGNVNVIVDGVEKVIPLVNGAANYTISKVEAGKHSIVAVYDGDETHKAAVETKSFDIEVIATTFSNITIDSRDISAYLVDSNGNTLKNTPITYTIDGVVSAGTTDNAGKILISDVLDKVIEIRYAGDEVYLSTSTSISLKNISPARTATQLVAEDLTQYSCEASTGEKGGNFTVRLVDASGNPLANKTVGIGYNGILGWYNTTEDGTVDKLIGLQNAGVYTFATAFLGDDDYSASFVVNKITIVKKPTSIKASDKSYKASASTKKFTAALSTVKNIDGKMYLASGKKITFKVNGKTYTAKTDSSGKATVNLKITKKGKYTMSITYSGDANVYEKSSKSVKITIK